MSPSCSIPFLIVVFHASFATRTSAAIAFTEFAAPPVGSSFKELVSKDTAMQTVSTHCAWLPLSRNSMLPAFISALFNFKDLFFSPLFSPTKM
jgi:hypothetical protein